MQKHISSIIISALVIVATSASAQTNFATHKIEKGETLSALAKQYNTTVGAIMRLNNMHTNSKLVLGETVKIPTTQKASTSAQQQSQPEQVAKQPVASTSSTTITHTVLKGETLYSIAKKYHVYIKQLETWNHLTNGSIKPGQILIINNNASAVQQTSTSAVTKQRVDTTQQTVTASNNTTSATSTTVQQQSTPVTNSSTQQKPQQTDAIESATNTKIQAAQQQQQTSTTTATVMEANNSVADQKALNGEGYFADSFKKNKNQQQVSGVSKTFKTASGWNDGKYYILADDINPGTIVKLTADNGNSVYAKVLWSMGSMKENNGLNFRISDAAAAALKENSSAFNLTVYY